MATEKEFYQQSERWLERIMELNPVLATQLGDHRWDDRLAERTAEAIESEYREMLAALAEFQAVDSSSFSLAPRSFISRLAVCVTLPRKTRWYIQSM